MTDGSPPITLRIRFPTRPGQPQPDSMPSTVDHSHVLRLLKIIRYSTPELRIGRRVPGVQTIAKMAGIPVRTVYEIINSGRMTSAQAVALADALQAMQDRGG